MTTLDHKYVVFRRADYKESTVQGQNGNLIGDPEPLADAVVIRTQDAFSGPALHIYALNITNALKMVSPYTSDDIKANLRRIADYFHSRAVEADERDGKVPD